MDESSLKHFKYGIFDLEGTLVDSMPVHIEAFAHILGTYNIGRNECEQLWHETHGQPDHLRFKRILEQKEIEVAGPDLAEMVSAYFKYIEDTPPFLKSGAVEVLHELRSLGMTLFVTTADDNAEEKMEACGIRHYFSQVMGSAEAPKGPAHIHEFAKSVNEIVPRFCRLAFLVGDSPVDMRLAQEMLIYGIGMGNSITTSILLHTGAKEVISELRELLTL